MNSSVARRLGGHGVEAPVDQDGHQQCGSRSRSSRVCRSRRVDGPTHTIEPRPRRQSDPGAAGYARAVEADALLSALTGTHRRPGGRYGARGKGGLARVLPHRPREPGVSRTFRAATAARPEQARTRPQRRRLLGKGAAVTRPASPRSGSSDASQGRRSGVQPRSAGALRLPSADERRRSDHPGRRSGEPGRACPPRTPRSDRTRPRTAARTCRA
jgi:hypothetical protein